MVLYLVVPCYNEEEVVETSVGQLSAKLQALIDASRIDNRSRIVLVNDGSRDDTKSIMHRLHDSNPLVVCIHFSGNFGHQNAVLAGYNYAVDKCDCMISIDADLQQDIDAIDLFLDQYEAGSDVVYGVRNSRETDGFFKKATSQMFYRLMKLLGCNTIPNHADYRLLSNRAAKALSQYSEGGVFLRGLIPTMGFPSSIIHFEVKDRFAGQSKYTLKKMLKLASDGITSSSVSLIHCIVGLGTLFLFCSLVCFIIKVIQVLCGTVVGASTWLLLSLWILASIQILSIGIIGEYIGKNYFETKKRPRYIIEAIED